LTGPPLRLRSYQTMKTLEPNRLMKKRLESRQKNKAPLAVPANIYLAHCKDRFDEVSHRFIF
jgi:hypothetical protein